MKRFAIILSTALILLLVVTLLPVNDATYSNVHAATGVAINASTFPDSNFRSYILDVVDQDGDSFLSGTEMFNTQSLFVSDKKISSLKGIEYFTSLLLLECNNNSLTSLDVSKNPSLRYLRCHDNQLTSLDVSNNTALLELDCSYNKSILRLDVSNNTALLELNCSCDGLSSLDLNKNTELNSLQCYGNNITILDISNNTDLETLFCYNNKISSLDVSKNVALTEINCHDNRLSCLDVTKNPALGTLCCYNNQLSSLKTGNNTKLTDLDCSNNQLTSLDVSKNTALVGLYCSNNQLTSLDVSKNTFLSSLSCANNKIKFLNIHNNAVLIKTFNDGHVGTSSSTTEYSYINYMANERGHIIVDNSTQIIASESQTPTPMPTNKPTSTPIPTKKPSAVPTIKPTDIPTTTPVPTSETGVSGFVERLYSVALNRASDPQGKADWTNRITSGEITGGEAARGYFLSPEFVGLNLPNDEFLNRLYHTFFDREPDEGGYNGWMNQLNNGASRESVLDGFINSTEWANLCLKFGIDSGGTGVPNITIAPNDQIIGFATRLYTTCLGRDADSYGLNDWATQLANMKISGSDAAHGFFFSEEFIAQNFSNEEYVNRLYRTFMGREADPAGFADWVGQLNNGVSRESVFQGFAGSAEWAGICAEYGILK